MVAGSPAAKVSYRCCALCLTHEDPESQAYQESTECFCEWLFCWTHCQQRVVCSNAAIQGICRGATAQEADGRLVYKVLRVLAQAVCRCLLHSHIWRLQS